MCRNVFLLLLVPLIRYMGRSLIWEGRGRGRLGWSVSHHALSSLKRGNGVLTPSIWACAIAFLIPQILQAAWPDSHMVCCLPLDYSEE